MDSVLFLLSFIVVVIKVISFRGDPGIYDEVAVSVKGMCSETGSLGPWDPGTLGFT
jgi:hypothetical protein